MRHPPQEIIAALKRNQGAVRATARELDISPGTVLNWRRRAMSTRGNMAARGLERHSTAPLHTPRSDILSLGEQTAIKVLRLETGWGAQRLTAKLGLSVHHASVHRFLARCGLLRKQKEHRRPWHQDTVHKGLHNVTEPGTVQMDVKYVTPRLSGLVHTTYLYAAIDVFSRYKVGSLWENLDSETAVAALEWCLTALPLTVNFVQTDNGLEFQHEFREALDLRDLPHHFIHKSSPNENALIERSFRTDQDEFFYWRLPKLGKPENMNQLDIWYQEWLRAYNTERPHLGLDLKTPAEILQI